jgi:hypothetical protein
VKNHFQIEGIPIARRGYRPCGKLAFFLKIGKKTRNIPVDAKLFACKFAVVTSSVESVETSAK